MNLGTQILEVGSNIFELIEFTVSSSGINADGVLSNAAANKPAVFGVNVAKVREVIRLPNIVPCLTSCPEVLGVFNLRGLPVPAIHLARVLGQPLEPISATSQLIVTEFSGRVSGFVVSGTRRIRRASWDKVLPPTSEAFSTITGMMLVENGDFVFILDFERILADIEGKSSSHRQEFIGGSQSQNASDNLGLHSTGTGVETGLSKKKPVVMVVDDSPVARRAVCEMLRGLGFEVVDYANGEQAWHALKETNLRQTTRISLIVSDVEMPRLDGYSLVKRVKGDPDCKSIPIVLHSSLTGEANKEQARLSGADGYVAKLNRRELIESLRRALPPAEASQIKEAF